VGVAHSGERYDITRASQPARTETLLRAGQNHDRLGCGRRPASVSPTAMTRTTASALLGLCFMSLACGRNAPPPTAPARPPPVSAPPVSRRASLADCKRIAEKQLEVKIRRLGVSDPAAVEKEKARGLVEREFTVQNCVGGSVTDVLMKCFEAGQTQEDLDNCVYDAASATVGGDGLKTPQGAAVAPQIVEGANLMLWDDGHVFVNAMFLMKCARSKDPPAHQAVTLYCDKEWQGKCRGAELHLRGLESTGHLGNHDLLVLWERPRWPSMSRSESNITIALHDPDAKLVLHPVERRIEYSTGEGCSGETVLNATDQWGRRWPIPLDFPGPK
jgi:hypothetical protein